jgi:long-chain acyl-CoA synthetase
MKEINKLYKDKIEEFQTSLASFEKVKKFILMPAEFEIGSGEITPTLKIKRRRLFPRNTKTLLNRCTVKM